MKTTLISIAAALVGFSAKAQTPSYTVNVARAAITLTCTESDANGGSQNCTVSSDEEGTVTISMYPSVDTNAPGFAGADSVTENGGDYSLILGADPSQTLQIVMMEKDVRSSDGQSIDVDMAISESNSLTTVMVSPFNVQLLDSQTVTFTGTIIAYGPASTANMVTAKDHTALIHYVAQKLKPAIARARTRAALNRL